MIGWGAAPLSATQLETAISDMRLQVGGLKRRLPDLDEAIEAASRLRDEADAKLRKQEAEVCRTQLGTGLGFAFTGRDYTERTVHFTSGGKTEQLSGPRPADTARGQADQARRVYDALEQEAQPIRAAVISLERERADVVKGIGLLQGEIDGHERQLGQIRTVEAEHVRLTGPLGWRDRLAAILRKLGGGA